MSQVLSLLAGMVHVGAGLVLAFGWLWSVLALWFFDPLPRGLRVGLATLWATGGLALASFLPGPWLAAALAAGVLPILLLWSLHHPRTDRNWSADQAYVPVAVFEGDRVHVKNLRHASYRGVDDYDVDWYEQSFHLEEIERVDFIVEPISSWRGLAHTFLTFGFADGEYLAISAEIRKERGETYSPLKGLFRQYELMYVCGDERDLIGLRANVRQHPVHLYPIRASKTKIRALFVSMLRRATELADRPEFYNTLTNTCATAILRHLQELRDRRLPFDLRVVFPGFADSLALDLNLIDTDLPLERVRQQCLINDRSQFGASRRDWSRQIRRHRTPGSSGEIQQPR